MITGTIEWPGHQLTRPVVFLDIEPGPGVVPYLGLGFLGDPVTGQFTMSYDLDIPITACVVAWDDLNQNDMLEMGEPVGWWDVDENGMWNDNDMIMIVSGSSIIDIYIELWGAGKEVIRPQSRIHIVNRSK
jgi:hypothetical protein